MDQAKINTDDFASLSLVMNSIRRAGATTRPEVSRITGLSRTLVSKHVAIGQALGLLEEGKLGLSTGGRAPRLLDFKKNIGVILVAELGATGMSVARSDLQGNIDEIVDVDFDIAEGPESVLARVEEVFDVIMAKEKVNLWAIGIGLPGPVEFATGIPMSPPIMPGWDQYPVRQRFMEKYKVPLWVDNDVNVMALGELSKNNDKRHTELIFIKMGSGIGAGIVIHGLLHRGAQGCAGDIGHIAISDPVKTICRCGNVGCLEAVAGGAALARDALAIAPTGKSKFLAERLQKNGSLSARDVVDGATHGDNWCVEAITNAGRQVGSILATLVNFFNPSLVVVGGGVSTAKDLLLASIRETVYRRSLPLATRDLEIRLADLDDRIGLQGAAEMVLAELFKPEIFRQWIEVGYPKTPIAL